MSLALPFQTAKQLAAAVRKKKVGCLELLDLYLKRVETHNPQLNAIIATDIEGARKRAKAADRAVKDGKKLGPLHGVPMTIKESYDVAGFPTTWGHPAFKDKIVTKNSAVAQRMIDAGVTLFGKTNVPLNLADWQSYNEVYGSTSNPWDLSRTPGGSSGGSGAALAAGLTAIEAGSDIGGSIRNPASYNGVWGHKPTWGVVSTRGHALNGRIAQADISVCGPLARGAQDLEIAMDVMAGPDDIDGRGWTLTLPRSKKKKLRDFKVGVILTDRNAEVDHSVQAEIQKLADFLGKQKVKVSDTARPAIDTAEMNDVYVRLLRATTSGRQTDAEFQAAQRDAAALPDDDMSYFAQMQRGNSLSHRTWTQLNEKRHQMRLAWDAFFEEYDLMIAPVAQTAAFPHDQQGLRHLRAIVVNNRKVPVVDQIFWAGYASITLLPATAAPIGESDDGLPIGVQIIGPQYGDYSTIAFAKLLEKEYRAFQPPPAYA
ncbi:amidase [Reyranella sp.]|uniref:amidase n=1 Tax=Reyranella sp. TaxID=1929291 RepID=UPI003BAC5E48